MSAFSCRQTSSRITTAIGDEWVVGFAAAPRALRGGTFVGRDSGFAKAHCARSMIRDASPSRLSHVQTAPVYRLHMKLSREGTIPSEVQPWPVRWSIFPSSVGAPVIFMSGGHHDAHAHKKSTGERAGAKVSVRHLLYASASKKVQ